MNLPSRNPSRRVAALSLLLFCLCSAPAAAQGGRVPQFKDYPVRNVYRGRSAPVVMDRYSRTFKTRLREAARGRPNFAGRYIVTGWGCGTGCQAGAVIDALTGKVYWFPFTIGQDYPVDENFRPVEFRLNSKLIIFSGARVDTDDSEAGAHFYRFENGRFVFLKFIKREQ